MSIDEAQRSPPPSNGVRVLAAMPIILTVIATILAGLSSSEMTQSMYFRSLAAQNQSKSGSQWAFFQAKRIRGTTMETSGDLLRAIVDPAPLSVQQLRDSAEKAIAMIAKLDNSAASDRFKSLQQKLNQILSQSTVERSLQYLIGPDLPIIEARHLSDDSLQAVVKAIRARQTEAQTAGDVSRIPEARVDEAIALAEANAAAFDEACQPIIRDQREIDRAFASMAAEIRTLRTGSALKSESSTVLDEAAKLINSTLVALRAAKQDFTARRYAREAAYNQESAELYEVLVRRTGVESERHRQRSRNFFYAMLCAQAGITIASFALARTRKNLFWAIAGIAGLGALVLGAYVYLAL